MMKRESKLMVSVLLTAILLIAATGEGNGQKLRFSVNADPVVSWMRSSSQHYEKVGPYAGVALGLNMQYYFADNYAFSTGISLLNTGGRQSSTDLQTMVFNNYTQEVSPGEEVVYNLRYLNIPAGLRLQTNQVGYLTFFTDLGIDLRFLLRSTVDLPGYQIENEVAHKEVYGINAGWHVMAGVEYELGIKSSLVGGIGFDEDFFDLTKDLTDYQQEQDRSALRILRLRLGIKF